MHTFFKKGWFLLLIMGIFLLSGCPALVVGGAAVSAGTGTYMYINGELKTDYSYSFDKTWNACEKAISDMHGVDVIPYKEIGKGTIDAIIDGEKVRFYVTYKSNNLTTIGIRVGVLGNQLASQRLHDKVNGHLLKK
ncbi:MAG: DUF3568 domain-containing protein [Deltaproteobacteria bacterium]|nr:DUF3568 domain-containing protein [Deltaproteobacteria bacterium]